VLDIFNSTFWRSQSHLLTTAELQINAELFAILEHIVELLEKVRQEVINDNITGSTVLSKTGANIFGDESTDFLLSLAIINDLLKFMCSKLTFFTDQIMGSINSSQVLVSEEKSDTMKLVKFAVRAHSEATADTFGILEVRKELVNEEVELADKDSAFLFIAGFVTHQGKKFFQSSHLGRVFGGFGEALDDLLALIANVARFFGLYSY